WTSKGGFTSGNPWIKMNENTKYINVEDNLKDKDSIFYYYQKLIKLRKKYKVISQGSYKSFLQDHDRIYAFKRVFKNEELLVLNNFYGEDVSIDIKDINDYEILIS